MAQGKTYSETAAASQLLQLSKTRSVQPLWKRTSGGEYTHDSPDAQGHSQF